MLVMKFWSLSYSALTWLDFPSKIFPLAAFLLADICSMIITSKLLHHSITSGHVTFAGNSHQNHAGSVTYRSPRQAALTIALAHPSADPSGMSDLKMFCPKDKRLQKLAYCPTLQLLLSYITHTHTHTLLLTTCFLVMFVLIRPGVTIFMPMAEPSSVLSVSQKLISAALLAL